MIADVIHGRCLFNILGIFSPWILHTSHVSEGTSVLRGLSLVILSDVVPQYPPLNSVQWSVKVRITHTVGSESRSWLYLVSAKFTYLLLTYALVC